MPGKNFSGVRESRIRTFNKDVQENWQFKFVENGRRKFLSEARKTSETGATSLTGVSAALRPFDQASGQAAPATVLQSFGLLFKIAKLEANPSGSLPPSKCIHPLLT